MAILSKEDLRFLVSPSVLNAALDDNKDGKADADVIDFLLEWVDDEVLTLMPEAFELPPGKTRILRAAARKLAQGFIYGRHAEYVRNLGMMNRKDSYYDQAKRIMLDLKEGVRSLKAPAEVVTPEYTATPEVDSDDLRDPWDLGGRRCR